MKIAQKSKPLLMILLGGLLATQAMAESVSPRDGVTVTDTDLVNTLKGPGITINGAPTLTAESDSQIGIFNDYGFLLGSDMNQGVIISTGNIADVVGANSADNTRTRFNDNPVTDPLISGNIFDRVKLNFSVTPDENTLIVEYVFGSEEYNEYVNGGFNDFIRIFVDGNNCAVTANGLIVAIDSINDRANFPPVQGSNGPSSNPFLYINNDPGLNNGESSTATFNTEMDGFTKTVSCRAQVTPGTPVTVDIIMADDGDASLDSWAFFKAQSLRSEPSDEYGDAPDSYQTLAASNGAAHSIVEGVYMGTTPSGDQDGFADGVDDSAGAAGDDASDDGVLTFPTLDADLTTSYSITVNATSINGQDSTIRGWIDFDGDGQFQADEASSAVTLAAGSFETDVILNWPTIGAGGPDIAMGTSFARVRMVNDAEVLTTGDFAGSKASGEVEDYVLQITGIGDTTASVVTIDTPPTVTTSIVNSYPVSGTCTAGDENVSVSITGANPGSQSVVCNGGGRWTANFDVSTIADGSNVIIVDASQQDSRGNQGNATTAFADKDVTQPTVSIQNVPAFINSNNPYTVTFQFDEDVTGFALVDVTVSNATASNFISVDANTYTVEITPDGSGIDVSIDVAANVAQDLNFNNNVAATQAVSVFDNVAPAVAITSAPVANAANAASYDVSGNCTTSDGNVAVAITGATPASQAVSCSGGSWTATFDVSAIGDAVNALAISASQTDAAGNTGSDSVQADKESDVPSVQIQNAPAIVNTTAAFTVTFAFSENVTGFDVADIALVNAAASNFVTVDASTYTAAINPTGAGNITIDVAANAAQDGAGNNNTAATQAVVLFDAVAPTVDIQGEPAIINNTNPFNVTFQFSEDVAGFNLADIAVGNGAASNFAVVNASTYTADITPSGTGNITIDVAANVAQDAAGNNNTAAPQASVVFDNVVPSVDIQGEPAITNNTGPFNVTFQFSENVSGFALADITVANGAASNLTAVNASTYTANITPSGTGNITIDVAANVAQDAAGNNNTAAAQAVTVFDNVAPTVDIQGEPANINGVNPFTVTFQFSEDVTGFVVGDIALTNASAGNFTAVDANTYTADITPSGTGDVTIDVAANVAQDAAGNNNTAATQAVVPLDTTPPDVDIQGEPTAANMTPFFVTFQFSEAVSGFDLTDITVGNATAGDFTVVDANTYTASITPDGNGDITIDVAANVAQDGSGNPNNAATQAVVTFDNTAPAVTVDTPVAANIANQTAWPVSGTCTTNDGAVNVRINAAGNNTQLSQSPGCNAGIYNASFDVSIYADGAAVLIINASQTDVAGNTGNATDNADKDTVAPAVPTVDALIANTATPTITGTAVLAAGETLTVTVNGITYTDGDGNLVSNAGNWALVIPPGNALADAVYEVTATTTDAAGNSSSDISSNELTVDTLAPSVPTVNSLLTNSTTPTLTGVAAAVTGETLTVTVNGVTYTDGDGNLTLTAGNWTLVIPAGNAITPDGVYEVVATLTDAAGNSSSDTSSNELEVDTTAPAIPTVNTQTTNNTTPVIDGTAEANSSITVVVAGATYSTTATAGGTWSIDTATATPDSGSFTPNVNGANTVFVTSTDAAGNATSDVTVNELIIDTTPPAVPTVNALNTNTATPTLTGTATVATGETLVVTVNGVDYSVGDGNLSLSGSDWTLVIPAGNALADATYDVVAVVTDTAGNNSSDTSSNELLVDTQAPAAPTVNALISNSTTPTLTGTATVVAGETLTVTVNGVTYTDGDGNLTLTGGNWTLVIPVGDVITPDGDYDVTATVTDVAGNSATDSSSNELTIDTTIQVPTVDSQTTNSPTPVITGTAEADSSMVIVVAGATYSTTVDNTGNWSVDTSVVPDSGSIALVQGNNDVLATSTDAAGNSASDISNGEIFFNQDDDNDGIPNSLECPTGPPFDNSCPDTDGDGAPDYLDTDSDNDGIPDSNEAGADLNNPLDTDGDGAPDFQDTDSDNDGTPDVNEGTGDADGDGIPDYVDLPTGNDFDGDGIPDNIECPAYPACPDTDADGIPDYADTDSDNDGIDDAVEAGTDPTNPMDTDGDGTPDYQDTDSDNDGVLDATEGATDADGDGIPDYIDVASGGPGAGDSDGDGIADNIECEMYPLCPDSDNDGTPDYMETDSDNDGIPDATEAGTTGNDNDGDGIDDALDVDNTGGLDQNGDGIDDTRPVDTDGDGTPDYQDTDSDNDGTPDATEGVTDTDGDGIPDYLDVDNSAPGDSDSDGIADDVECPSYPSNCPDSDGDGVPDYMDGNDNDGPLGDIDNNGTPNYLDPDDDGDGILDTEEDPNLDGDNNPATGALDTDGDGISDYQDTDSDGDGVPDATEGNGDTDGDGIPDYLDVDSAGPGPGDSDGDGIADNIECPAWPNCPDSDGDGIPDYMDSDSDNDGIPDAIEFGGLASGNPVDTDGDGTPDYQDADSDNDGVNDATEAGGNPTAPVDSDGDGIPDYADPESSGLPNGGDSDGDGVEDAGECISYPACADADGDNIPDYNDADSRPYDPNAVIKTGLRGIGANEPLLLLALLSAVVLMRRRRNVLVLLALVAGSAQAAADFPRTWYLGAGLGASDLTPETGNTGFALQDGSDSGYKLFTGVDINARFSVEVQQSFLGTAQLDNQGNPLLNPNAEIDYELPGVSLLWYGWHEVDDEVYSYRHGWQAFLMAGLSSIENSANVPYDQDNNFQIHFGGGVEYGWDNGIAVRAGVDAYDEDATFIYVAALYRFGYDSGSSQTETASDALASDNNNAVNITPAATAVVDVPTPVVVAYETVVTDGDNDGVADSSDQCPDTPAGVPVNPSGCSIFGISLEGVNFETNSADITADSEAVLNNAAKVLKDNPQVKVEVQAHTDDRGRKAYNQKLSDKRAASVREYLIKQGVAPERLTAKGYGETQPVADNSTAEGRAKNRRVELKIIQ